MGHQEMQEQDRAAYTSSTAQAPIALHQITQLINGAPGKNGSKRPEQKAEQDMSQYDANDECHSGTAPAKSLLGELPPVKSTGTAIGKGMGDAELVSELQRISAEHQEERQKLQLSIQMEKARQRQKLLQRRKLRKKRRDCVPQAPAEPKQASAQDQYLPPVSLNCSISVPSLRTADIKNVEQETKPDFKGSSSVDTPSIGAAGDLQSQSHPQSQSLLYLQ